MRGLVHAPGDGGSGAEPWSWVLLEEVDFEKEAEEARQLEDAAAITRDQQRMWSEKVAELEAELSTARGLMQAAARKAADHERAARRIRSGLSQEEV